MKIIISPNTSPGQSGPCDWATLGWLEEGLSECARGRTRGQWKETRTAYSFGGALVLVLK